MGDTSQVRPTGPTQEQRDSKVPEPSPGALELGKKIYNGFPHWPHGGDNIDATVIARWIDKFVAARLDEAVRKARLESVRYVLSHAPGRLPQVVQDYVAELEKDALRAGER